MDAGGNIYELTDEQTKTMKEAWEAGIHDAMSAQASEDVARLDGFMRGRVEAARSAHEKLVWDSTKDGTYRKP